VSGGQSKTAVMAALSSPTIKPRCVIGVDDDIDLGDLREIAWSMASRIDAALDVQTIAGLPEVAGAGAVETATKWFVDSTKPPLTQPVARADFERALPKGFERIRLADYLPR